MAQKTTTSVRGERCGFAVLLVIVAIGFVTALV
jgi:hypothetical protein